MPLLPFRPRLTLFLLLAALAAFFPMPKIALAATIGKPPSNLGLVGYWPLNDGSGSKAGDASGNGNTGTVTGATWTAGNRGNSLDFNGTDQHVIVNASSVLNPTTSLTVSAWIKPDAVDNEWSPVVESGGNLNSGTGYFFGYYTATNSFVFEVGDGSYDSVSVTLPVGRWYHVVGTYSASGNLYLYVNGAQVGTHSHTVASISYDSNPFTIGKLAYCCATGHHFDGQIDDVRIYNRALSATDVSALYQSGQVTRKSVSNSGLVGYWPLNDGSGYKAGDSSGNGNTGTITGASWTTGKKGGALNFNGSSDYAAASTTPALDMVNTDMTVSAWIYIAGGAGTYRIIASKNDGLNSPTYEFGISNTNKILWYQEFGGSALKFSNTSPSLNQWHQVAFVFNDSAKTGTFYLDGAADGAVSGLIGMETTTAPLYIGVDAPTGANEMSFFNGKIDDLRIYSRALSATEIAALYTQNETKVNASQNSKMTDGLVGLWSFDGPDVTSATAYDRSGNSRDSTLTGSPVPAIGKIGQGMSFTGSGQYARGGSFSEAGTSNRAYTFSAWVKPATGETDGNIIHMSSQTDGMGWCLPPLALVSGYARGYSWNGGGVSVTGTSTISSNVWTHIVNTWDSSGGLKIYVNGSLENTTAQATYIASGSSNYLWLAYASAGCAGEAGDFEGSVDDVRVYGRALSAEEVYRLYTLGK